MLSKHSRGDGHTDPYADFWAPDPTDGTWRDHLADLAELFAPRVNGPQRLSFAAAVLSLILVTAFLSVHTAPRAEAAPAAPVAPAESLDSLLERADKLSEEYRGELRDMEAVIEEAEQAQERADATRKEVDEAREQVRYLAVATYTSNGLDPALSILLDPDPQEIIDTVSIVDHLSHTNNDKISYLLEAMERDEKAQANAEEKLEEAEADLEELEERRWEVRRLIAKYPVQEMTRRTTSRRAPARCATSSSRNSAATTERRCGCYRPNGGWVVGEHPQGAGLRLHGQRPRADAHPGTAGARASHR